jgi:hypothetical protein
LVNAVSPLFGDQVFTAIGGPNAGAEHCPWVIRQAGQRVGILGETAGIHLRRLQPVGTLRARLQRSLRHQGSGDRARRLENATARQSHEIRDGLADAVDRLAIRPTLISVKCEFFDRD